MLFFIVALLRVFGAFDPITTHITLEMLVFAAMATLVCSMLRSLAGAIPGLVATAVFVFVQLATPATWVWYGSGLENVWVSAGLVALLWLCVRTARGVPLAPGWGNLAFAVAITRPEAPVYVAAFYGAVLVLARPEGVPFGVHARQVVRAALVTAALFVVFLAWRRIAYGAWLPNTYYAKLHETHVGENLRDYVVRGILPYARAGVFALSVLALLVIPKLERVAACVLVFVVASLALPLAAGADWMGEHRFATPFLVMAHIAYAMLLAVCIARLVRMRPRDWLPAHVLAIVVALVPLALLVRYDRTAVRSSITPNDVTVGRIAHLEGGLRWEQQMRIGVPFPVVQLPDAGGSMLVGGMQMLDNGYLTDFQMARIGRRYGDAVDLRVLNQYQHAERRPDLVSIDDQFALDRHYLDHQYLMPPAGMAALGRDVLEPSTVLAVARGAVVLDAIPPDARLVFDDARLQIYLSADTVPFAGPGGLVRCELIVRWTEPIAGRRLRASIEGDHDEIALRPYQRAPIGIERFAVLLRTPDRTDRFPVSLELVDGGATTALRTDLAIEVTAAPPQAVIDDLLRDPVAARAARRLAWLREQRVPRLGMAAFHALLAALDRDDRARSPDVGAHVMRLRETARLAAFDDVPAAIHRAEVEVAARLFATCSRDDVPRRIACLGRQVDTLRRLGYLGAARHVAAELAAARDGLDGRDPKSRYQILVGLALATPADLDVQRALLAQRLALARLGELPALP